MIVYSLSIGTSLASWNFTFATRFLPSITAEVRTNLGCVK